MNWLTFFIATWLCLGLDLGLRPALALGGTEIAPSFVMPLLVYVCLFAPARTATWAALALGMLIDLTSPMPITTGSTVTIVGPQALGSLLAAQLVLQLRTAVFTRSPLTLVVLSATAAVVAQIAAVACIQLRSFIDPALLDWNAGSELMGRAAGGLYTGLIAVPLSFPLFAVADLFRFHTHATGRYTNPRPTGRPSARGPGRAATRTARRG